MTSTADLPALVRDWERACPAAWEEYEERSAILEYDARLERSRAERAAEYMTRQWWAKRSEDDR